MKPFVHSIMMLVGLVLVTMTAGCKLPSAPDVAEFINPDPAQMWYDGAVFNTTDENRRVYIADPDPEYGPGTNNDYTKPVRLDAVNGVASYWLRERYYTFVIVHAVTGDEIARIRRKPNAIRDDASYGRNFPNLDWSLVNKTWTE